MDIFTFVLSLIGALAWIPIIISFFIKVFRRIHCIYLDRYFIYNAEATFRDNGKETKKQGMILILALNLFVYQKPFFTKDITCKLTFSDGSTFKPILFEGVLGYFDTSKPPKNHIFVFPGDCNINTNRSISADSDNIRIIPFFAEGLNLQNDETIKKIEVFFKHGCFKKKITLTKQECIKMSFIHEHDKII